MANKDEQIICCSFCGKRENQVRLIAGPGVYICSDCVQACLGNALAFYGEEKIGDAIWFAKDLKDRYTVLWMYYDFLGGGANV